jgi:hypothetical protein
MADANLNTSISALTAEILSNIPSAGVEELLALSRSAAALGQKENSSIETALNSRVNQLYSSATPEQIKKLSDAVNKLRNPTAVEQQVGNSDNLPEGLTNLYYTDTKVQTKLGNVSGHILPDSNETYDLGSASNKFRDLYLSSNTIHLGDTTISSDATGIVVDALKVGTNQIDLDSEGNLRLPSGTVPNNVHDLDNVTLDIPPETLTIAIDANMAGGGAGMDWLWSWDAGSLPYARTSIRNQTQSNVPIYNQGTYTVFNFAAHDLTDTSLTQTHKIYLKWVDGPGTDNLVSWATSTLNVQNITFDSVRDGSETEVQRINISVPSTITPPTLTNPSVSYDVSFVNTGNYTFGGNAFGDNPTLTPLYRGGTYTFNVDASGHPFYLTTDNGANFISGSYVDEYTSGVTGSRTDVGTVTFTVPMDAPDTLFYQCGIHGAMQGEIAIKDLAVETNVDGNYILYFQHDQQGHKTPVEIKPVPTIVGQVCLVYNSTTQKFEPQDLGVYLEQTNVFKEKVKDVAEERIVEKVTDDTITNLTKVKDQTTFVTNLYQQGELQVHTGTARWYAPYDLTISDTIPKLNVAADATVSIQINKNDVSQSSIDILGGQTTASPTGTNKTWNMNAGDYLTVDILTIGTTNKGEDLVIQFKYKQT